MPADLLQKCHTRLTECVREQNINVNSKLQFRELVYELQYLCLSARIYDCFMCVPTPPRFSPSPCPSPPLSRRQGWDANVVV
jgi:hypothetical protein